MPIRNADKLNSKFSEVSIDLIRLGVRETSRLHLTAPFLFLDFKFCVSSFRMGVKRNWSQKVKNLNGVDKLDVH